MPVDCESDRQWTTNSPPNSPGFVHSTEHTTSRGDGGVTHSTVHVTSPIAPPVSASRPVMPFPEKRTVASNISKKTVTVRADTVQRVGNTIYMKNPTKVDVTRVVPKEKVTVTRTVAPAAVRVAPVVLPRSRVTVVQSGQEGRPVIASKDHIPTHSSEIAVAAGEPLLYLGSSSNMWSRVRKHNGEEGYIPHSRISQ